MMGKQTTKREIIQLFIRFSKWYIDFNILKTRMKNCGSSRFMMMINPDIWFIPFPRTKLYKNFN